MPRVNRHAKLLLCVACVLFVGSNARAATVVWTIDTTLTTMGLAATGRAPLSGAVVQLKVIQQGITPALASITPTVSAKVSGTITTDTDFTNSITFLRKGLIEGETTGNFSPDITGVAGTKAPGDVGASVVAKIGPLTKTVADGVFRDMRYDFTSPAAAITGGSFSTAALNLAITNGHLDYRGIDIGADLGSGTTNVADPLDGDANIDRKVDGADYTIWADNFLTSGTKNFSNGDFTGDNTVDGADYTKWADNFLKTEDGFPGALNAGGNGTITIVGNKATLTIPLLATVSQILDEADSSTTTDDVVIDFKFLGSIVAHATVPAATQPIPEPSTMALAVVAGVIGCAVGVKRKLRRSA